MTAEFLTISEAAERYDLTLRALRFYEEKGLVSPHRDGRRRIYSPKQQERLAEIRAGLDCGLSLEEIRQCLYRLGVMRVILTNHLERLHGHRAMIDRQIAATRDRLDLIGQTAEGALRKEREDA